MPLPRFESPYPHLATPQRLKCLGRPGRPSMTVVLRLYIRNKGPDLSPGQYLDQAPEGGSAKAVGVASGFRHRNTRGLGTGSCFIVIRKYTQLMKSDGAGKGKDIAMSRWSSSSRLNLLTEKA